MASLVTIFGGSGFVGRYVAQRMAAAGWRVRVAVRHPKKADFVTQYGEEGQVETVRCNLLDDASVQAALTGADVAVNCVGILAETGKNKFAAVQAEGAARIARLAAENGVARMVQISAIGADSASESLYATSKAEGEAAVQRFMPDAVILRPSIIFGPEDQFFNRFAAMTRLSPFVPVVGADTRFQPVYVQDVAHAAEKAILGQAAPGIYELGGPDVESFRALMARMLKVIKRRRIVLPLPMWIGRLMAFGFDTLEKVTFGMIPNAMITRDQVKNLARDNVVAADAKGFADLGIEPVPMASVLPDYLWKFMPSGQYESSKESAKHLRNS
ncbi:MAG: complex I NDUFA9 subunit family protein [Pseudomonadota bacterium]